MKNARNLLTYIFVIVPILVAADRIIAAADLPKPLLSPKVQFCPEAKELIKVGDKWMSKDSKWKSYTPSAATKVVSFIGAQWVGIKLGAIICLYKTNEAVAFPLSLEQTQVQSIPMPTTLGWSALIKNRKLCQSASVADCSYLPKEEKKVDPYQEIKYQPKIESDQDLEI